jgi:hypothetical protein
MKEDSKPSDILAHVKKGEHGLVFNDYTMKAGF